MGVCGLPGPLPMAVFALIAALVIPGAGWLFLALLQLVMMLWLAAGRRWSRPGTAQHVQAATVT